MRLSSRAEPLRRAAPLALLLLALGCAQVTPPPVVPEAVVAERQFLLPPGSGYPGPLEPGLAASLNDLHQRLLREGAAPELRRASEALLGERPDSAPIQLLQAQLELVGGELERAAQRVAPLVERWPTYDAAGLLLGYAHERLGDLPSAFEAYRQIAGSEPIAAQRVSEIRSRALEIVANRLAGDLEAGDLDSADRQLGRLQAWAPDATGTLQAARRMAAARRDGVAELATVRELSRRLPEDAELRDRLATLEVAVGDPGAGISILQEMAAERPGDPELAARLSRARFRWRLVLLPSEVRSITRSPELRRSDLAALLYWIFPSVRYARPPGARIANDVFDHDFREEIVRVINLELMEVDPGVHQFEPARPVTRAEALAALLRVVASARPEEPCLGSMGASRRWSWPMACAAASSCRLIEVEADCLPAATLSGAEAVELSRRAQLLLGGE